MASIAFGVCLVISALCTLWFVSRNYENIDMYYWTVIVLIPIVILGYWLKTQVRTPEAAWMTFCFIYFDSTMLMTVVVFILLRLIEVSVKPWIKLAAYSAAFLHLFAVWTSVYNGMYFRTMEVINSPDGTITKMTGGPLRIFHYVYLGVMLSVIIGTLIAGFFRKGTFSRRSFRLGAFTAIAGIVIYIIEGLADLNYSMLPFLYAVVDVIFVLKYDHIHAHDISAIISEYQNKNLRGVTNQRFQELLWPVKIDNQEPTEQNQRGYVAFDKNKLFLSCNAYIYNFWPELKEQWVDEPLAEDSPLREVFYSMIDAYNIRGELSHRYTIGDKTCVCEVNPFSISRNGSMMGYFFEVRDETKQQEMMDQITEANSSLETMVANKTSDILSMQDKIVTGMANMVENRDSNTGGHVKRTSDIIRIILDEIMRQGKLEIDEKYANDIVRAAPMHDLGKISIENSILNKPGKLTDEEFNIMRGHAAKSGEIVMILLDGVEEGHFVDVAYNVARYHHERWDGRGYPEGLTGSMIPLEARIMAVADVYDALACKRSYKEAMDPKRVADIMLEGMGTQFDPQMKPVFLGCRKALEVYYRENT